MTTKSEPILYLNGDATAPRGDGHKILVHCVNDLGAWGAGFVVALARRWPAARNAYLSLSPTDLKLGSVQFVRVADDLTVANLVGQRGLLSSTNPHPVKYKAIKEGLVRVAAEARTLDATIHMPRMGCGLAGGSWDKMEPIILDACSGISVTVYTL